jgi:hypothetical protein
VVEPQQLLEVDAIADRARSLWRDACDHATTAHVELFAKVAVRSRVRRDLNRASVSFDRVFESGLAVRTFEPRRDRAGFAAAAGLSAGVVRWAVDTACAFRAQAPVAAPCASDGVAAERWDLDATVTLPTEESLTVGLLTRPHLEWIEAGTTVEVLVGHEGWLAVRSRHRFWALCGRPASRLVAQRGVADWERLLDGSSNDSVTSTKSSRNLGVVVLSPDAAASVVGALVAAFHGRTGAAVDALGRGWDVADEPVRHDGLAGGSFDDAGFPAASHPLASDGVWVGRLEGPGTFRRASFREPPTEAATNLCMPSGPGELTDDDAAFVERCRVLRPSAELWVLEIDLRGPKESSGTERRWIRIQPKSLLASCAGRLGRPTVTSSGPIVPALRWEGLVVS